MNFELTEEQQKLQEAAIKFATGELATDMIAQDRDEHFDRESWRKCADFGVLSMPIPVEYGGTGLTLSEVIAVMEGLAFRTQPEPFIQRKRVKHMPTGVAPLRRWVPLINLDKGSPIPHCFVL